MIANNGKVMYKNAGFCNWDFGFWIGPHIPLH